MLHIETRFMSPCYVIHFVHFVWSAGTLNASLCVSHTSEAIGTLYIEMYQFLQNMQKLQLNK